MTSPGTPDPANPDDVPARPDGVPSQPDGGRPGTDAGPSGNGRAVVVGLLAGFTSGLFGVGGGVVIVPGLVMLARFPQRLAHGTSLTAIVPIALAGMAGYAVAGEVDLAVALLVAAGGLVGAPLGVAALARLSNRFLQLGFAGVLLLTAVRMVMEEGDGVGRVVIGVGDAIGYVVTGLAAGMLAGLMGVGGGVIIVPLLTIVFGFPLVLAKGTSLAVIVPTALVGTLRNIRHRTTDLRAGVLVGAAGVLTAAAASQISLGLDPTLSAWLFAALLVLVAVRLVRRARSGH